MTASEYDPVSDIVAPLGTYGWTVSRGWITSREDLLAADAAADDLIYVVPQDQVVRDVVGQATLVQLRLHRVYPSAGLNQARPRSAGIHQLPPRAAASLRTRWTPSPCGRLSRPRTTTGPPPRPGGTGRRRTFPPAGWLPAGEGTPGTVPTFTVCPLDG